MIVSYVYCIDHWSISIIGVVLLGKLQMGLDPSVSRIHLPVRGIHQYVWDTSWTCFDSSVIPLWSLGSAP